MIDLARVAVLAIAIVYAARYRFALGLVFGACLACALGWVSTTPFRLQWHQESSFPEYWQDHL